MRRRILWVDAVANLQRTSDGHGIRRLMSVARAHGISTVVFDVKPTSGEVLYPSDVAPSFNAQAGPQCDRLAAAVEAAHEAGLELFVSINVFVEGVKRDGRMQGTIPLTGRKEWEVIAQGPDGSLKPLTEIAEEQWAFVNPALDAVRQHELQIIEEIVSRYPVAGIVLDRARYPGGVVGDFSDTTRQLLEREIGGRVGRWPDDVFRYVSPGPGAIRLSTGRHIRPGPYFGSWLQLRARIIREFVREARARVRKCRPDALLGIYAGSWYPIYYELGVNWANPATPWALEQIEEPVRSLLPRTYAETGYAFDIDLFMSGNYYPDVLIHEAGDRPWWMTVEGAAQMVNRVTERVRPVYGSLFLEQYRGRADDFRRAVQVCLRHSDGVMLFDTCHLEEYGWWDQMTRAFTEGGVATQGA